MRHKGVGPPFSMQASHGQEDISEAASSLPCRLAKEYQHNIPPTQAQQASKCRIELTSLWSCQKLLIPANNNANNKTLPRLLLLTVPQVTLLVIH